MAVDRYRGYDGKYRRVADQLWVADVLRFPPGSTAHGRRYRGRCPRCGHALDIVVELRSGVIRPSIAAPPTAESSALARQPAERSLTETIFCNCTEEHEEREKEDKGCGIFGDVAIHLRASR
jgi:hypothetical protein